MLQLLQHKPLWSSAWFWRGLLSAAVRQRIDITARYALMPTLMVGLPSPAIPLCHEGSSKAQWPK